MAESNRDLKKYHAKRDFKATPEPKGEPKSVGRTYVVQKHDDTRLLWDLRLEHRGVLLSWAGPKEPSLDPDVKRLAVRTEDHPLDYATFEGTIPKGNYGAGTVEIWDRGSWMPEEKDVDQALADGKLSFDIYGERLKGNFALVRMGEPGEKENWLLFKHRRLDLQAPGFMLCRPVEKPPTGGEWLHEIKWDGYRTMALIGEGECRFMSRGGNELKVPDLQAIVARHVKGPAIIDGELVVFDDKGVTDFGALQATLKSDKKGICFVAFDLLLHEESDLKLLPLEDRKKKLQELIPAKHARIRFSDAFDDPRVFKAACEMGLEGIVSKKRKSPYRSGRFDDWRKAKCSGREVFIVAGYTIMEGTSKSIGSLIVGQERDGKLEYAGRLGTGFDSDTRVELFKMLEPMKAQKAPFVVEEAKDKRGAIWVEPRMTVKGKFLQKTSRGVVRQATFDGILELDESKEERPAMTFKVTSGDRVMDQASGATKQALADYYVAVIDRIFPQLQNRPVSVIRCPGGVAGECFFQRHLKHEIEGTQPVKRKDEEYIGLVAPEGILGLVQFGGIEFHPWGAQMDDVTLPDRLILDLDPGPKVKWEQTCDAARFVREKLEKLGMKAFLKISGGKGIHLVCPIVPELTWDEAKAFTKTLAESFAKERPKEFVAKMTKALRDEKMYVDYLRNDKTATAVAAYSLRARPNLPCAWPIRWDELEDFNAADAINISNFQDYLNQPDPWANMPKAAVSLRKLLGL